MDGKRPLPYRSYLIRMWWEESTGAWRVTLQDPQSEERMGFGDLESLYEFFETATGERNQVRRLPPDPSEP